MAIDPTELSIEQTQRTAMDTAGAPTQFAQGPEQGTQVAFGGAFADMLRKLGSNVIGRSGIERVPTPQERRLVQDMPTFSERQTQAELAPQVLSPEGVQRFEQRGFQAPQPNQPGAPGVAPETDILSSATDALDQSAIDAANQAENIRTDAGRALTADQQGYKPETAVAPEAIADPVLDSMMFRDREIKSLQDGGDFNFDYINSSDDVKAVITAVGETLSDAQTAVTRGVISNETTIEQAAALAADEIGMTRKILSRRIGDGAMNAAEMVAAREILVRSSTRLATLAEAIRSGQATAADRLAFRRQLAIHAGIQLQVKGAQTEAARALQSFQIPVSGELDAARLNQEALRALQDSGASESTDALAQRILQLGNLPEGQRLAAINSLAEKGWAGRSADAIGEAYMVGLLSSPSTQMKNLLGTVSFMAWQLPEEILAGAWGSAIRGLTGKRSAYTLREDQVQVSDAMIRLKGWVDSVGDAFRIASQAYRTEIPTEMMNKIDYNVGAIRWPGEDRSSIFARAVDELGKRARIPFRLLLAGDEFFKTVSQRGELYVSAYRRYAAGLRNGADHQTALDDAGMVLLDPRAVSEDVIYRSRYDTMTLDTGVLGKVARQIQDIPVLGRIVLPFATAPTNDMLRTLERLPIPIGGRRLYEDLLGKNGPRAQQLALGRWSLGSMTFAYAANLTTQGRLTGAMPDDPKVRDALPPGWQPYSVVVRGEGFPRDADGEYLPMYDEYGRPNGALTYVNYAGYGPVSAMIGLAASVPQSIAQSRDPEAGQFMATAAVGAVANYYKELPMLQGVSQIMDFTEGFDIENLARSPASVATPVGIPNIYSSLQRGIFRGIDPTRVTPRDDVEYYTMQEVEQGFVSGDPLFTNPDGTISFRLVGTPKGDFGSQMREAWTMLRAYQQQDSMFADERDLNAVVYDTLGNVVGAEDVSFASRPGLALWNLTTGMIVKPGRELTPVEQELARLSENVGGWPLTNPRQVGGINLSAGAQSDLTRIAKNEAVLNLYGAGYTDFRGALEQLIFLPQYVMATDAEKRTLVRNLNQKYIDAGLQTLLALPDYANLRQAYTDAQALKEQGIR